MSRRTPTALLATSLLVAGLALTGCSQGATRDAATDEVTESGDVSAFAIKVGDCFNDQSDGLVTDVPAVPCADAHDNEAYFVFDLADGEFDEDAMDEESTTQCTAAFEEYVDIAYLDSQLDWFTIAPSEASWADGDREVVCSLYGAEQLTGSMKGAAL